jgi:hypothetical protein
VRGHVEAVPGLQLVEGCGDLGDRLVAASNVEPKYCDDADRVLIA